MAVQQTRPLNRAAAGQRIDEAIARQRSVFRQSILIGVGIGLPMGIGAIMLGVAQASSTPKTWGVTALILCPFLGLLVGTQLWLRHRVVPLGAVDAPRPTLDR